VTTTNKFPVSGWFAPGFERVRSEFEENFRSRGDVGAAVHVTVHGEPVVDLWGGAADSAEASAWQADTLVNVWSTTKGCLALALHMLADGSRLDFDAPIARYWPEFAQHGKDRVLVRHALTHTAGLPGPSMKVPREALYDWTRMIQSIEQSSLFWQPGTRCGYHAGTFGWLNGELLRRITGVSVGAFFRSQIATPLGADIYVGLTEQEQERTAETIPPTVHGNLFSALSFAGGRTRLAALNNPPRPAAAANTRRWREAEIPSSNGHASARGLARVYTALALRGAVGGVRLLSARAAEAAAQEQVHAKDIVLGVPVRRTLGFVLAESDEPRPAATFGHPGMGGSIGFADLQNELAMGYVMNRMLMANDNRYTSLCRAVYDCLRL
jgi:CubicO group peptidase (beta-lactamase class C family)